MLNILNQTFTKDLHLLIFFIYGFKYTLFDYFDSYKQWEPYNCRLGRRHLSNLMCFGCCLNQLKFYFAWKSTS